MLNKLAQRWKRSNSRVTRELGQHTLERRGVAMQSATVQYKGELLSQKEACLRADVSLSGLQFLRRRYGMSSQEAFECLLSRKQDSTWTADRIHILRENFMQRGADIPELMYHFGAKEIKDKACELGLRGPNNPDTVLDGTVIPYAEALVAMGVAESTAKDCRTKYGWTPQEVISRLSKYHLRLPDGSYMRTAKFFFRGKEDYICAEGKLWDATAFCRSHNFPEISVLTNLRNNHKMTLNQAYEYCCIHRGEIESGPPAISISLRSTNLKLVHSAYTGTDGLKYYFAACTTCERILLLSSKQIVEFKHGELCNVMQVPEGACIPKCFIWNMKQKDS